MSETTNQTKDLKEILNLMNRVNETFGYGIWLPSLNKEVMFRELNTSQQKRLIKSVIDSPIYNTEFIFTINQIIKENCIEKVDIDELTILDKLIICLKMRAVSVNDTFEISFKTKGNKQIKRGISVNKMYEDAKAAFPIDKLQPHLIKDGKYEILCGVPTLKTEYKLEREFRSANETLEIKDAKAARQAIGDVFITELIKFIKEITIKIDDEQEMKINFNDDINCMNRLTIIENIPVRVIDKVINYINDIKADLEKLTLVKFTYKDDDGETQDVKEGITIDGNFFINS
jgi:hypothetical protein